MQENPYAAPQVDPHAVAPRVPGQNVPQDWTIGEVLSTAWNTFKREPWKLLGGMLLMGVCVYAVLLPLFYFMMPQVFSGEMTAPPDPTKLFGAFAVTIPVLILVQSFFVVGWFRFNLAALREQELNLGLLFSGAGRMLPVIGAGIVVYLALTLGLMLLIVPGIIVSLGLAMVFPLLADSDISVSQALSQSWESMKGHKGKLFLFVLVYMVVQVVANLVTFNLATLFTTPLFSLSFAEIYRCVTGRREQTA